MLSIVIPFFNRACYVIEMIKSIQASTYTDWELLLVDDGSSNEDYSTVKNYTSNDIRIHLLQRDRFPKGAQTCRNIGFEHVRGNFVCFFDSDDYITPECLQTRVRYIQSHPDKDFIVFPTGLLKNNQLITSAPSRIFGYPVYANDLSAFASRTLPFIVCSNIYRTASIRRHQLLWDEELQSLQDGDYNVQALLSGLKYEYALTKPDYFYRIELGSDSVSKNICSDKHFASNLYSIEKNYSSFQHHYGNLYNKSLYRGVLFLFNNIFRNQIDSNKALKINNIVTKYDPMRGKNLQVRIYLILWLSHIIGTSTARRLVMYDYLVWQFWNSHRKNKKQKQWT